MAIVEFLPLVLFVAIIWAIVNASASRRRGGSDQTAPDDTAPDPATSVRRVVLYGLLFVTMILAAEGVTAIVREVLDQDRRSNSDLAQAISFLVVGVPSFLLLLRFVDARLRTMPDERAAIAWSIYLNAALLTTLVTAMVATQSFLSQAFGDEGGSHIDSPALAAAVVWAGLWSLHWFHLRQRHGIAGDLHLSVGTLAGLITLATGGIGLLYVGADEIYTIVTDDPLGYRRGPSAGGWVATLLVGMAVWGWFWIGHYRHSRRTDLWHITVVPIGSLAGFVGVIAAAATMLNAVAVWFIGNASDSAAARHFDLLPMTSAVLFVGLGSWLYHRSELAHDPTRNESRRAYEYLLAAASLITAVIGLVLILSIAFAFGRSDRTNTAIAGGDMLIVGAGTWIWFWGRLRRRVSEDSEAELGSPIRRIYVFALFGATSLTVLGALIALLNTSLEDVLDGTLSRSTLHASRFPLAILIAVSGVAWYHFLLYRSEREKAATPAGVEPVKPLPRVVVVASDRQILGLVREVAKGRPVEFWPRSDEKRAVHQDLSRLERRLAERPDDELLVIFGDGDPVIIPMTPRTDRESSSTRTSVLS